MASRGKRPAIRADRHAWLQLGKLLQRRRAHIGGGSQTRFAKARKVSVRRIRDIENASRKDPSSWQEATLQEIADFYEVDYRSMLAVLRGEADDLVPAAPASVSLAAGLPPAPPSGLLREDADRPWATPVWEALLHLADRGVLDPDGDQLVAAVAELIRLGVLPAGTVPLSEKDAQAWDSTAGAMVRSDRVWLVSDLRRRREAFSARQGANSA